MRLNVKSLARIKPVRIVRKNSPELLVILGVGGVVASAVGACKATLKLEETLDEIKTDINNVREEATEEDSRGKELTTEYFKAGVKIARLYALPVVGGALSIGCIVGSHKILKKRNIMLLGAYETLDQSYRSYRARVKERLGVDEERDIHLGITEQEYEVVKTGKDGKEKKVKKKSKVFNPSQLSPYAVIFDETCDAWERDAEYNKMFLIGCQNHANDLLNMNGHVFLNDVRKMLGLPDTPVGQMVGWVKNGDGDGFIDFGIFDTDNWKNVDFVNGFEQSIILDFNVDGVIWDKI